MLVERLAREMDHLNCTRLGPTTTGLYQTYESMEVRVAEAMRGSPMDPSKLLLVAQGNPATMRALPIAGLVDTPTGPLLALSEGRDVSVYRLYRAVVNFAPECLIQPPNA